MPRFVSKISYLEKRGKKEKKKKKQERKREKHLAQLDEIYLIKC